MNEKTQIIQNPLIQDALAHLRSASTPTPEFRRYADIIVRQLIPHAFHPKDLSQVGITTPVNSAVAQVLSRSFIALPILRSGLSMLPAFLETMGSAKVGFAGLVRDEKTAEAREYYWKIPNVDKSDIIVVLDPMIATGGSVPSVLRKLRMDLDNEIRIISIIASKPGIMAVESEFPEVSIITSAIDGTLNAHKYITPGLGDFGDRYFGTEHPTQAIKNNLQ